MTQISLETPEIGKPDATEDQKIITCFTTIQTAINGNLDSTNIKPEGVTGENLELHVTGLRLIAAGGGTLGGGVAAGTYMFPGNNGAMLLNTAGTVKFTSAPPMLWIRKSEFEVAPKSVYLTLAIDVWVNGTAPAASMTFSLYKLSSLGGISGELAGTFGIPVAGTGVVFTTPALGTINYETKKAAMPTEGAYIVGVETNGVTAAASVMGFGYHVYLSNQ